MTVCVTGFACVFSICGVTRRWSRTKGTLRYKIPKREQELGKRDHKNENRTVICNIYGE